MGVYAYAVGDQSLGTSTAKTELSGNQSGSAGDWILPAACKGLLAIEPYVYQVTPTSTQTVITTLKVESDDLGIKDFEVLAPPIGGAIATTNYGNADLMRGARYPLFFPSQGGERIQVYGIPQIANSAAPYMGATIWWTDDAKMLTDKPYRARVGGTPGAAGATTSTGTSTGNVSGATISISGEGQRTIRGIYGIIAPTTIATVKPIAGYFTVNAPEFPFALSAGFEPMQGPLGTAQSFAHLTRVDELAESFKTPSTLTTAINLTAAPSTAGNFANGVLYQ